MFDRRADERVKEVRGMCVIRTENHLPEKPKEQLNQKVMELDSQSADLFEKLEKSWKPGMRFTLSAQFSGATESARYAKRFTNRV